MIHTCSVERCAGSGDLALRVEDFRQGDQVTIGVASARDQDVPIGQRRRSVTRARNNKRIELLDLVGT